MRARTKQSDGEILQIFNNIGDEKVRYFYLMLGEAIADAVPARVAIPPVRVNTSAAHLAELEKRLSAGN